MKKSALNLIASVALLASLTGCGPKKDKSSGESSSEPSSSQSSSQDEYGPDEEAEELVLPTNVTHYELDQTDYDSLEEARTDVIRVYYHRFDNTNDYMNYQYWRIWAWDTGGGNGWWYEFTKYNEFGVICEIPVADVAADGVSINKIGLVITTCQSQTSTWTGSYNKDPDSDIFGEISPVNKGGVQRLYVKSGDASVYYSQESVFMSTMEYARYTDMHTVRVIFFTTKSDFQFYKKRFHIFKNGSEVDNFTINDFALKKSGGGYQASANLVFSNDFEMTDLVKVQYKVSENYTTKGDVILTGIYDSEEFINDYTYTGNDLGATFDNEASPSKTIFKVWAPIAASMKLNIYETGDRSSLLHTYDMTLGEKGVWSYTANENLDGKYYTYTVTNYIGTNEVVDPYAKSAGINGKVGMIVNFTRLNAELDGWAEDERYDYGEATEASIYEMHIRDMTINPNSGVSKANRGKYLGLTEDNTSYYDEDTGVTVKTGLNHLEELGVTHVQVQPTYDYSSVDEANVSEDMSKTNYNWGYDPQNYNALEGSYSSNPIDGESRIKEFKQMVMALHDKSINTIMDVVYNHTSSFADNNFELLMPLYYHRTRNSGTPYNGSGCGNEMATERFMCNKFVRESCEFYTDEYHLSGFRFDLMGLIDNQTMIDVYKDCSKLDSKILIYGEPWTGGSTKLKNGNNPDALTNQQTVQGSLAQPYFVGDNVLVGAFSDGFRNGARGDNGPGKGFVQGIVADAANLLPGIQGLFNKNQTTVEPQQVINYVSCHDNYTLYDQLIISMKGADISMMYNQAETLVFTSQGVPFLQEGEEFMRSKAYEDGEETKYSGNSYNVGDFINNMDYSLKVTNSDTFNYFKDLIAFRKANKAFTLNSREEINEKVTEVKASNGLISYKVSDGTNTYAVYHTCKANNVSLDAAYELVFTNTDFVVGEAYASLALPANGSAILKIS